MSVAEKSTAHPSRSSSLNNGRPISADMPYAQPTASGQIVFENGKYQDRPTPNQAGAVISNKNGLQELAGLRAQLLAIQRRLLEHVGNTLGWSIGWAAILPSLSHQEELSEVNLTEKEEEKAAVEGESSSDDSTDPTSLRGIVAGPLVTAVSSIDQFRQNYEVSLEDAKVVLKY